MADDRDQKRLRKIRSDSRHEGGDEPIAYQDETGDPVALTGDETAPYIWSLLRTLESQVGAAQVAYLAATGSSLVAKSTAGRLYQALVFNPTQGSLTFQVHNRDNTPGAGDSPFMTPITLPTQTMLTLEFGHMAGVFMPAGIVLACSSTYATFTSATGLHITAFFR